MVKLGVLIQFTFRSTDEGAPPPDVVAPQPVETQVEPSKSSLVLGKHTGFTRGDSRTY